MKRLDFGRTAEDYGNHRAGFPQAFFHRIKARGLLPAGTRLLDIGAGTGTIARGMAREGCLTYALDLSAQLIAKARQIDALEGLRTTYHQAAAERTAIASDTFDIVAAGQCWHWFDGDAAAAEIKRILSPSGRAIIAHFDWLPKAGNVVAATENLISLHNPSWSLGGGNGFYPAWLDHLEHAGFVDLETFTFDQAVAYSHRAWRGRIRASAGVGATLSTAGVRDFDIELKQLLAKSYPTDPLVVPHRVFVLIGKKPRQ